MNIILAATSGILLALAFPKFDLFWLAWIALVPFFWALLRASSLKEALGLGLAFGLPFFGIHLFWLMTLFDFVKWWILLGFSALVVYQTLFILLFVVLVRAFIPRSTRYSFGRQGFLLVIGLAAFWTLVEWLRAFGPWGVSGGDLGYSQVSLLALIQMAALTSVYGVSFVLALFNAALAVFLSDRRRWQPLGLALVVVAALLVYGQQVLDRSAPADQKASTLKLALIQPNVKQQERLDPRNVDAILKLQEEMSRQAMGQQPAVIVWPETSLFTYLLYKPALLGRVKSLAVEAQAWLVLGTPHYIGEKTYNSIISIDPSGRLVSRYDKERLVPFGEYLPFRPLLYTLLKSVGYFDNEFSSNPNPQPLTAGQVEVAAAVCFESTLPELIRARVRQDSAFILLLTNDAWFADSSALYFHLNTGVLRAVENRKYFVQVGNTGISAVIDPYGRILKRTKVNQRRILFFEVPLS